MGGVAGWSVAKACRGGEIKKKYFNNKLFSELLFKIKSTTP
jgi:hypothetical protein